jgi:hypothetical protein
MKHIMNTKMIPIAVVLATAALLALTAATPIAFAESGDQRSETNSKYDSEADCNFSGKGNTCAQIPINIEIVGDI